MANRRWLIGGWLLGAAALAGCAGGDGITGSDPGADPGEDPGPATVEAALLKDFILGLSDVPTPEAQPATLTKSTQGTEIIADTVSTCSYDTYEGTALYESLVSFDPNVDSLWPGSVIQSEQLSHGLLAPIGLARQAGTITLTNAVLHGTEASYSRELAEPSLASVQDAIADILAVENINLAAKASFVSEEASSLNEAALKTGVSVDWMGGNVKASFDGDWTEERTSYVIRFVQNYYTVSFAPPSSPEQVFADHVTVDDAVPYMWDGNTPAYISNVTYGRMLLVKVESSYSSTELKAALDSAFSIGVTDIDLEVEASHKEILNQATFTVFALGGDPNAAVEIMAAGSNRTEALRAYFKDGASFSKESPGVPISYTTRRLANNQAMKVASAIDYEVPNCDANNSNLSIYLDRFDVIKDGDGFLGGAGEINYKVWVGDVLQAEGTAKKKNGETITLDQEVLLTLPQTNGESFEVRAELNEDGDHTIYPSKTHTFVLDGGSASGDWTQAGDVNVSQSNGNFEIALRYSFNPAN